MGAAVCVLVLLLGWGGVVATMSKQQSSGLRVSGSMKLRRHEGIVPTAVFFLFALFCCCACFLLGRGNRVQSLFVACVSEKQQRDAVETKSGRRLLSLRLRNLCDGTFFMWQAPVLPRSGLKAVSSPSHARTRWQRPLPKPGGLVGAQKLAHFPSFLRILYIYIYIYIYIYMCPGRRSQTPPPPPPMVWSPT